MEFDEDARLFLGVVVGLRDVVPFSGRTADELAQAFRDSIDDYLAFCEERGTKPENLTAGISWSGSNPASIARLRSLPPPKASASMAASPSRARALKGLAYRSPALS
jgi:hypothetical protein